METINEVYLKTRLKDILELCPEDGVKKFFTGMYNYVPLDPKSKVHANDYYLYVKVFNSYFENDIYIIKKFSDAIEQFLDKKDIVNSYIAYEILISQMLLTKNKENTFEIDNQKMINWFNNISLIFKENKDRLNKINYGISKLYENGMEDVIKKSSEMVVNDYGVRLL